MLINVIFKAWLFIKSDWLPSFTKGNQSVAQYLTGINAALKVTEFKRVALG